METVQYIYLHLMPYENEKENTLILCVISFEYVVASVVVGVIFVSHFLKIDFQPEMTLTLR